MFFDLFKSSTEKTKDRMFKKIKEDLVIITQGLNVQINMVVYFEKIGKDLILYDKYSTLYFFGAFDAATIRWGLDIRKKIGPSLITMGFIPFLTAKFEITKDEAEVFLEEAFAVQKKDLTNEAIIAGGTDGMEALQGGAPKRLDNHFTHGSNDEKKYTSEDLLGFKKYNSEENERFINTFLNQK